MQANKSHKFAYLDGLRGVAALVVVFHHFAYGFYPAIKTGVSEHVNGRLDLLIYHSPLRLLFGGDFAVAIFFVLSGFVLSYKFLSTGDREHITSGSIRRYFRLLPPVLGSVLAAYLLLRLGLFFNQPAASVTGSEWLGGFWRFAADLPQALYQGFFGVFFRGEASYNINLWTMQAEFFGSYLVFLLLAIFGKIRNRSFIYLALAFAFWNTFYLAFLIGVVLSDLWTSRYHERLVNWLRRGWWMPALGMGLLFGAVPDVNNLNNAMDVLRPKWLSYVTYTEFMHVLGGALIVLGVLSLPRLQAVFNTRVAQYLGKVSFSLYVVHLLVIGSFSSYLFMYLPTTLPYAVRFLIMLVPSLVVIFLWSNISTRHLDQPAIRLSGKLYRLFFGKRGKPEPMAAPGQSATHGAPAEPAAQVRVS